MPIASFRGPLGLLALASYLAVSEGCASQKPPPKTAPFREPLATVRRFAELVDQGRVREAYKLTLPEYRKHCDLPCFGRAVALYGHEAHSLLRYLRAKEQGADLPEIDITEEVTLPLAPTPLKLVKQDGGTWKIAGDPLEFYPQDSAQAALSSFLRAVKAKRYDVLARFMPMRQRGLLGAEHLPAYLQARWEGPQRPLLLAQIAQVEKHLQEPLILHAEGGEARLPLSEGETRLLYEEGRWVVLQLR